MFRKSLSVSLCFVLLLECFPLESAHLGSDLEEAKSLSDSIFDGKRSSLGFPGVLVAANDVDCSKTPEKCQQKKEEYFDNESFQRDLNSHDSQMRLYREVEQQKKDLREKCRAGGVECPEPPLSPPLQTPQSADYYKERTTLVPPTEDPYIADPGPSYTKQRGVPVYGILAGLTALFLPLASALGVSWAIPLLYSLLGLGFGALALYLAREPVSGLFSGLIDSFSLGSNPLKNEVKDSNLKLAFYHAARILLLLGSLSFLPLALTGLLPVSFPVLVAGGALSGINILSNIAHLIRGGASPDKGKESPKIEEKPKERARVEIESSIQGLTDKSEKLHREYSWRKEHILKLKGVEPKIPEPGTPQPSSLLGLYKDVPGKEDSYRQALLSHEGSLESHIEEINRAIEETDRELKSLKRLNETSIKNLEAQKDILQQDLQKLKDQIKELTGRDPKTSLPQAPLRQSFSYPPDQIEENLRYKDLLHVYTLSLQEAIQQAQKEITEIHIARQLIHRQHQQNYLKSQNIDPKESQESLETLKKHLGSNPWKTISQDSQQTLNKPEALKVLRDLDLRTLISYGPYDSQGNPLLGQLQGNNNNATPGSVVIPGKLSIRSYPGASRIGQFGWSRDNSNTFHSGVDLKAQFGLEREDLPGNQQRGYAIPISLNREVRIVEVGHQSKGHGNRVIAQDTQEPNTIYVLAHAGEDARYDPNTKQWIRDETVLPFQGILVKDGETIPAYRTLVLMGHSGNAATSNPKDYTADTHIHLEKHVVPDEAVVSWPEARTVKGKKVKHQYSMTFEQIKAELGQVTQNRPVTIELYNDSGEIEERTFASSNEAMRFLQARLRELLFNARCDTDGDGRKERCYARNPLE